MAPTTDLKPENVSVAEAVQITGLSAPRIRQLLAAGELPVSYETPLGRLIPRRAAEQLRDRRRARATAA